MKILLISDVHGSSLLDQIDISAYDKIVFCGDGLNTIQDYLYLDNTVAVRGNCDFLSCYPLEQTITTAEHKILVTHGHIYSVKQGLAPLLKYAQELNTDIVFFGHTHLETDATIDGIRFINPGALKDGKYKIIDIEHEVIVQSSKVEM